ncbi:MAG: VCBS repeat-containing protein [Deltaproteobacteria bacterium]|nr:VCBS repeat-containing protein [Deltaproteobacteria bacterium]
MRRSWLFLISLAACGGGDASSSDASAGLTGTTTNNGSDSGSGSGATATIGTSLTTAGSDSGSATEGVKFDVPVEETTGTTGVLPPSCKVEDDMNGVGDCTEFAPPDAFEPVTQWDFMGPPGFAESIVTPLVANMTDDNGDGEIDLCDIPDVVVVAGPPLGDTPPARIYVLDGATGVPHFDTGDEMVQWGGTPALGDIDGDGMVEIVTSRPNGAAHLVAFGHDGTLEWESSAVWNGAQSSAVALADVDGDGDVEIAAGANLFDHTGALLWSQPANDQSYSATAIADLDGDDQMEILVSGAVFHADGTLYWNVPQASGGWSHPQVADLDDDPEPEVLYALNNGVVMFEHDGTLVWGPTAPAGNPTDMNRPINIHNYDLDDDREIGAAAPTHYGIYNRDASIVWTAPVLDASGQSGGTAFDFIGAGVAQAIYMDESTVYVFDDAGSVLMQVPYRSGTIIEYPTVADIDNDGSAEILVASNTLLFGGQVEFTVRAVRDVRDRWVQARRIWNQHSYHVTNVREDGTIPQHEPKHWGLLNTFRTQAQIEQGGLCQPQPRG